jgi:competence protein ComEC
LSGADLTGQAEAARAPIHRGGAGALLGRAWRELVAERERWPLWLPVFLGTGVAVYFALDVEPALWLGPLALALVAIAMLIGRRRAGILTIGLPLAALALGFSVAAWRTAALEAPRLERRLGPVTVSGRVVEVETLEKGRRVTLDRPVIERLAPERTPVRVRVHLRGTDPPLRPGDRVSLRAVLLPPPAPVAPGAFDFQRQAYYLRLGAVGYAFGRPEVEPARPSGFALWLSALRDHIAARITAALTGPEGGIAAALMTGERGAIPADVVQAMRDSGLAHLLAISGLHLGLITGALFFGIRALLALMPFLALRYPIKKWAAFVALGGALFYMMVTGATVPTQRAVIMTGVVLLGVLLDRTAISMRMVCWAGFAILLIQPESLLGPSFQLSFAAVIALVAAYETLRPRLLAGAWREGWGRLPLVYLVGVAFTSLVTTLATIPYSLYHFDRLAAFGVVTNMIAVPVTALWVMPWAIVAYVLMPLGLESLALQPMGWGLHAVIWAAKTVQGWPGSVALLPAMPVWGLVLVSLGLLWLCLWQRPWRLAGVAGMALGLVSIPLARPPDVIVSGDARLFAVRASDGRLMVSAGRDDSFDVDTLMKRAGQSDRDPWPKEGASADGRLACDGLGCVYRANGQRVALAEAREALEEDCRLASVVISAVPVRRRCVAPRLVIDRFALWRAGGHALWLDPESVRVESVAEWRGDRPWAPAKPARAAKTTARPSPSILKVGSKRDQAGAPPGDPPVNDSSEEGDEP